MPQSRAAGYTTQGVPLRIRAAGIGWPRGLAKSPNHPAPAAAFFASSAASAGPKRTHQRQVRLGEHDATSYRISNVLEGYCTTNV